MNAIKTYMGSRVAALFSAVLAFITYLLFGPPAFRARTCDIAFGYRMGVGFPGEVNRTHPFSVLPSLINTTTPPRLYGDPVFVDTATNSVRGAVAGDNNATAAAIYGFMVRPYPTQQSSGGMSSSIGAATPPVAGIADVLRQGFMIAKLPPGASVTKNGIPYVWCAVTAGNNIQGGLVAAASAGNTLPIANARFTGPAAADGTVELEVWPLA